MRVEREGSANAELIILLGCGKCGASVGVLFRVHLRSVGMRRLQVRPFVFVPGVLISVILFHVEKYLYSPELSHKHIIMHPGQLSHYGRGA